MKTVHEINEKIRNGDAVVVTAEEMIDIVDELGAEKAAVEIDVVTTGTFGAMCSSGAFLNFGHSDPPIKMCKTYLNGVEAYSGIAAVDAYLGATQTNSDDDIDISYGGSHVLEDLVAGKEIELVAEGYTTDCYPRKKVETTITIDDLNQAILVNPRNCYQSYNGATNSTEEKIYTYMGALLPEFGNLNYSGAGQLNPLQNDFNKETKTYNTLGMGTRIFLGGAQGYIAGSGTQHSPNGGFGTLMVQGDLKEMNTKYLRGATIPKYGSTLYMGIGIPIPVLNAEIAKTCAIKDEDIAIPILDYGIPRRDKPELGVTNYKDARSGKVTIEVEIEGKKVDKCMRSASVSSYKVSREISKELKNWISNSEFMLTQRLEPLKSAAPKPMKAKMKLVKDILSRPVVVGSLNTSITEASRVLIENNINHLPIVDENGKLSGIITSWDIAKAMAQDKHSISEIMTTYIVSATPDETIDMAARKMSRNNISGLPVVDSNNKVLGVVSAEDISKLIGRNGLHKI
ncbi:uncharacterized protein (DUF39 family)/CBS domain-containing protein [Methanococcus maripaludis]|uniref:Uncharacterized protein (DUF39 family)/CBS domain-containing protein n=1 Tax=Methanococcus maripaludis TaxID=39152 RepID=A0A7J9P485_METMI|nr:homocysteine biosynthesis protein [Methanococcus maripaludis]MBA2857670.1 uncharacterized protein (DUF39 family)/CBS domain-containing protein [Methanococcus maripaludis]